MKITKDLSNDLLDNLIIIMLFCNIQQMSVKYKNVQMAVKYKNVQMALKYFLFNEFLNSRVDILVIENN